jgi:hypothetical protein
LLCGVVCLFPEEAAPFGKLSHLLLRQGFVGWNDKHTGTDAL